MFDARGCLNHIKPYIPGKPIEEVEKELGIRNIIKMASNENPLGPSGKAIEAIARGVCKVNIYPDANGFYLKDALAKQLHINRNNIILGNGSEQLIGMITKTFVNPGDEVVMAHPSFSVYTTATQIMSGIPVQVPLDQNYCHDLTAILNAITNKTKIVFICNPNNPTGTIVSRRELDNFMNRIPSDILVVLDEAYFEYVDEQDKADGIYYVLEGKNVVVLRTFSKIYGLAGLRIGYGIAHEKIINTISKVKEVFNVNSLAQAAALASINDPEYVERSIETNRRGKEYLCQEFKKLGLKYIPTQTNFILVDIGMDCQKAYREMMKNGIIVRPGDIFGYPTFLRVSIGRPEENLEFIEMLEYVIENNDN